MSRVLLLSDFILPKYLSVIPEGMTSPPPDDQPSLTTCEAVDELEALCLSDTSDNSDMDLDSDGDDGDGDDDVGSPSTVVQVSDSVDINHNDTGSHKIEHDETQDTANQSLAESSEDVDQTLVEAADVANEEEVNPELNRSHESVSSNKSVSTKQFPNYDSSVGSRELFEYTGGGGVTVNYDRSQSRNSSTSSKSLNAAAAPFTPSFAVAPTWSEPDTYTTVPPYFAADNYESEFDSLIVNEVSSVIPGIELASTFDAASQLLTAGSIPPEPEPMNSINVARAEPRTTKVVISEPKRTTTSESASQTEQDKTQLENMAYNLNSYQFYANIIAAERDALRRELEEKLEPVSSLQNEKLAELQSRIDSLEKEKAASKKAQLQLIHSHIDIVQKLWIERFESQTNHLITLKEFMKKQRGTRPVGSGLDEKIEKVSCMIDHVTRNTKAIIDFYDEHIEWAKSFTSLTWELPQFIPIHDTSEIAETCDSILSNIDLSIPSKSPETKAPSSNSSSVTNGRHHPAEEEDEDGEEEDKPKLSFGRGRATRGTFRGGSVASTVPSRRPASLVETNFSSDVKLPVSVSTSRPASISNDGDRIPGPGAPSPVFVSPPASHPLQSPRPHMSAGRGSDPDHNLTSSKSTEQPRSQNASSNPKSGAEMRVDVLLNSLGARYPGKSQEQLQNLLKLGYKKALTEKIGLGTATALQRICERIGDEMYG